MAENVNFSPFAGAGAQFFDNSGSILSGGLLYTYQAGSTTPQATYTTLAGITANTNPIVLDSAGRTPQEIWLLNGYSYKFVLKTSAGVLIGTYDNIPTFSTNLPILNDASSIAYEQGYTVNAGSFVTGSTYLISFVGTTNFVAIGAASNTVGVFFVATGAGSGTGTAKLSRTVQAKLQESVSVLDFGADPTGVADSTASFLAASDAQVNGATILIPPGTYKIINLTLNRAHIWQGSGMQSTIIKTTSTNACFILDVNDPTWNLQGVFNDMRISGPDATKTAIGIQLGNTSYVASDELTGRIECNRVNFLNLDKCFLKLYGNIGNTFNRCYFSTSNYHIHSTDKPAAMHGGNDSFLDMCHLSECSKAVFYYDSAYGSTGQLYVDGSCIIESNPGFVLFIKNFRNNDWSPGIVLDGPWLESNAFGTNISIDGDVYGTAQEHYIRNAGLVIFRDMELNRIDIDCPQAATWGPLTLDASNGCHYNANFNLTKTADAAFIPPGQVALNEHRSSVIGDNAFVGVSYNYSGNILFENSCLYPIEFTGGGTLISTGVVDGVTFPICQEVTYTTLQRTYTPGVGNPTVGKYVVCGLAVKKVSGDSPLIQMSGAQALFTFGYISNTTWQTYTGITKVASNASFNFQLQAIAGTSTIRLGGFFAIQFDTYQEALYFLSNRMYPATITYTPPLQYNQVSADNGDADVTLYPNSSKPTQIFSTPLTTNRTVTLSTTNVNNGSMFRITRTGTATGAYNLVVGASLKTLDVSRWCDVQYNGTAWMLVATGTL